MWVTELATNRTEGLGVLYDGLSVALLPDTLQAVNIRAVCAPHVYYTVRYDDALSGREAQPQSTD